MDMTQAMSMWLQIKDGGENMKIKAKIDDNTDVIDFSSYNEIWDAEKWEHLIDKDEYGDDWYMDWVAVLKSISIDGREVDLTELDPYAIFCRIYRQKLVELAKEILSHDTGEGVCYPGFLPDPEYSRKLRDFLQNPDCEEATTFKGFDIDKATARRRIALEERNREQAANSEQVWREICDSEDTIIEFELVDR